MGLLNTLKQRVLGTLFPLRMKAAGKGGGGGEGFEFMVSRTLEIFERNFRSFWHFQEGSGSMVYYICGIFTKSPCSWAKRMKKNVFQSCCLVDSGIRHHMNSCVWVTHNAFFSLGCAGFLFSEPTVFCLLCEVSKRRRYFRPVTLKTCFHS